MSSLANFDESFTTRVHGASSSDLTIGKLASFGDRSLRTGNWGHYTYVSRKVHSSISGESQIMEKGEAQPEPDAESTSLIKEVPNIRSSSLYTFGAVLNDSFVIKIKVFSKDIA